MYDSLKNEFDETREDVQEYINARIDLMKLNIAESLSRVIAGFVIKMILFFILFFAILFISLAFASWLDSLLNSPGIGFLIVGGLYLLVVIIFVFIRHTIIEKPIIEAFIELFFPPTQNYDKK